MKIYEFDETSTTEENLPIVIKEGEYEGMVYTYGNVQFKQDEDDMKLIFNYDIITNPTNRSIEELDEDETFQNLLGDLLLEIIDDELSKGDDVLRENEDND